MGNQPFSLTTANWPDVCKNINITLEKIFKGHNYVFRSDGADDNGKIEKVIFLASEQRLSHSAVSAVVAPLSVVIQKNVTGGPKIIAKNPFDILDLIVRVQAVTSSQEGLY